MVQSCAKFKRPLYYLLNTTCSVRRGGLVEVHHQTHSDVAALLRLLLAGGTWPDPGATVYTAIVQHCRGKAFSAAMTQPHCTRAHDHTEVATRAEAWQCEGRVARAPAAIVMAQRAWCGGSPAAMREHNRDAFLAPMGLHNTNRRVSIHSGVH